MNAVIARTPYFVLRDGNQPIGPPVVRPDSGDDCSPIYGFSAAIAYHEFRKHSDRPLTPYPLVKGYLRAQAGGSGAGHKLVVIDAGGPAERRLQAATMEAVLEAQERTITHVAAGFQLILDQETNVYRVESNFT
jgi:hypothetical protein